MKQNTIWTGVLAVASAFALLLTGCGKSQTAARDTSAKPLRQKRQARRWSRQTFS